MTKGRGVRRLQAQRYDIDALVAAEYEPWRFMPQQGMSDSEIRGGGRLAVELVPEGFYRRRQDRAGAPRTKPPGPPSGRPQAKRRRSIQVTVDLGKYTIKAAKAALQAAETRLTPTTSDEEGRTIFYEELENAMRQTP